MPRRTAALLTWAALAVPAGAGVEPAPGRPDDPWRALERLRSALTDTTVSAGFRQSYVPAGFEVGDSESGVLALALPDCLRWDYLEPYRKTFLICGDLAWSWVEGEPRGQRMALDADRQMGLDLLLLSSSELSDRYRAQASPLPEVGLELTLEPLDEAAGVAEVRLSVGDEGRRPLTLSWRDRQGNVTEFRFEAWRPPEEPLSLDPPPHLDWSDPTTDPAVR